MSVFEPEAVESLGNTKVVFIDAVTNPAAASLATDLADALDVTLTIDVWDPQVTRSTIQSRRRLGHRETYPREGIAEYQPIPIHYPYDPQADDEDPNNKAKAELEEGLIKHALVRKGKDALTPLAATDKYELWKGRLGAQVKGQSADDQSGEYEIEQNFYPMTKVAEGAIVA